MSERPVVLIADDDQQVRSLLQSALKEEYSLIFARDGLQAIALVKKKVPDMILIDIHMPKLSGWQLIREIRALGSRVPIVVITGFHDPYNAMKAKALGVTDCLSKPFDLESIRQTIRESISQQ